MFEMFDTLVKYLWVGDFAALSIFFALAIKQKEINSSLMALVVTTLVSGTIIQYQSLVNSIQGYDTGVGYLAGWSIGFILFDCIIGYIFYKRYLSFKTPDKPLANLLFVACLSTFLFCVIIIQFSPLLTGSEVTAYKDWVRVAYYLGTALLQGCVVYVIHQMHRINNMQYSLIARMYLLAFFVAAQLQIIRFIERFTWDTHVLAGIYRWGLASINIATTAVVLFITCLAIYQYYNHHKIRKGELWNI